MEEWSSWRPMPSPENCRDLRGPKGPGLYQVRNKETDEYILFGISIQCHDRMKSLYPIPYGVGNRESNDKRQYILKNWMTLEYRTLETKTRVQAAFIEKELKSLNNHKWNT